MASGILNSRSPILLTTAAALSPIALAAGALGFVSPRSGLELLKSIFGFQPASPREAENFMLFWASRDLFMGIVTVAAWYHNDARAMGYIMAAASVVCVIDGRVSQRQQGKGAWVHWGCVPVFAGLSAALLGAFD